MNRTNFEHGFYGIMIQSIFGVLGMAISAVTSEVLKSPAVYPVLAISGWWMGAVAATFFFLGREHAQREYKKGEPGKDAFGSFDFAQWTLDEKADLLAPAVSVSVIASAASYVILRSATIMA